MEDLREEAAEGQRASETLRIIRDLLEYKALTAEEMEA